MSRDIKYIGRDRLVKWEDTRLPPYALRLSGFCLARRVSAYAKLRQRNGRDWLRGQSRVTGELLHNGQASRLYQALVKEKQVALSVDGGLNWPLGTPYEFNGPTVMTSFVVYPNVGKDQLLAAYDSTVKELIDKGPSQQDLDRIVAKMRSCCRMVDDLRKRPSRVAPTRGRVPRRGIVILYNDSASCWC